MKNKDFLDALGDIDQDMIDDASPENGRSVRHRWHMRRILAAAACAVLILGGVFASRSLWDKSMTPAVSGGEDDKNDNTFEDGVNDDFYDTEAELTEAEKYNSVESWSEGGIPAEVCTEYCEPTLVANYAGERYQKYSFTYLQCDETVVGEKIDEITLNCNWSDMPEKVFEQKADVFEVIGRDGVVSLCYKYADGDEYYYLNDYGYAFTGFTEMVEKLGIQGNMRIADDVSYKKKTEYCYCDRFYISDELSEQIAAVLFSSEGERIEDRNLYHATVYQVEERVTLHFVGNDMDINFEVLSNGLVFSYSFGAHLFDIGAERALQIIKLVQSGEPAGYVWNEEYSEWYTVCEEDEILENPPETFREMMELRGIFNTGYHPTATYRATKIKLVPPYFTLGKATYAYIVKFVFELDGEMLLPEDEVAPAYECVELTLDNGSDNFEMHIFSAGYISFGGFDYFVGVPEVEKLISIVVREGNPAPGYYWNENAMCWVVGDFDETYPPAFGEDEDTFPYETVPIEDVETETATENLKESE